MSEYYEDMCDDDIANEIMNGATELQNRIYTLKEREAILVRRLSDLVNCISAANNSRLKEVMDKAREALNAADTDQASGAMSAQMVLVSILSDAAKYPEFLLGTLTKTRIERALKYLD